MFKIVLCYSIVSGEARRFYYELQVPPQAISLLPLVGMFEIYKNIIIIKEY